MVSDKTKLTQVGRDSFEHNGSVNHPLYQTSTILFKTLQDYHAADNNKAVYKNTLASKPSDLSYGISGTETTFALQKAILELEGGSTCILVPSGLSAISTVLFALLKSGDHLLMVDSAYGPARRFCNHMLKDLGIATTYYDPTIGAGIESLIQPNTKVIWLEAPGSLTFEMQDIGAITEVAKRHSVTTVMDNSYGAPLFCHPLEHGVDIVIAALSKYYGGHSDILMGSIITGDASYGENLQKTFRNLGLYVSPSEISLVLRGLRSVAVRLEAQQKSALKIAELLEKHPKVKKVLYPALPSDSGHALWKKYFKGAASLFSIVLDKSYSEEQLGQFINGLQHFGIGVSWGGYESLIIDFKPQNIRTATKWPHVESCVRIYIGLEDADDLWADLEAGLKRL